MQTPDHVEKDLSVMDDNTHLTQATSVPSSLPFRAVLVPHRSLSPPGFLILMAVIGVISFGMGVAFAWVGAWPVLGFFGLDVAIVYLAFKLNYRAARAIEMVEVTRDELTITRLSPTGKRRSMIRLSSTWAKIEEIEAPDGTVTLSLASHGRRYALARGINSDERRSFARALRAALLLVREPERG
jgi:uncharacterized membrane protein